MCASCRSLCGIQGSPPLHGCLCRVPMLGCRCVKTLQTCHDWVFWAGCAQAQASRLWILGFGVGGVLPFPPMAVGAPPEALCCPVSGVGSCGHGWPLNLFHSMEIVCLSLLVAITWGLEEHVLARTHFRYKHTTKQTHGHTLALYNCMQLFSSLFWLCLVKKKLPKVFRS